MEEVHYDSEQPEEVKLVQKFFSASTKEERGFALIELLSYIRDSPDGNSARAALDKMLRHMWLSDGKPDETYEQYLDRVRAKKSAILQKKKST